MAFLLSAGWDSKCGSQQSHCLFTYVAFYSVKSWWQQNMLCIPLLSDSDRRQYFPSAMIWHFNPLADRPNSSKQLNFDKTFNTYDGEQYLLAMPSEGMSGQCSVHLLTTKVLMSVKSSEQTICNTIRSVIRPVTPHHILPAPSSASPPPVRSPSKEMEPPTRPEHPE
eukprot:TRINITY_DN1684_c0_g1_i1.p1 TRINITY_DN1684_c0_g1~~TRINITY_DN1684_c0_g1_i1.p1  ORF type:complete len:167 (+),score=4.90 TRINITY_DN1684_c0_g1_i1:1196-1696(+)